MLLIYNGGGHAPTRIYLRIIIIIIVFVVTLIITAIIFVIVPAAAQRMHNHIFFLFFSSTIIYKYGNNIITIVLTRLFPPECLFRKYQQSAVRDNFRRLIITQLFIDLMLRTICATYSFV